MPVPSLAKLDRQLFDDSLHLLRTLISTPSMSRQEDRTADHIAAFLKDRLIPFERHANNIIAIPHTFDAVKPTLLLNSHHDTVAPNRGYSRDPYSPDLEGDYLYGLGSNDAGGALVSLLYAFRHFIDNELPVNLVWVASAEEEISGSSGIAAVLNSYAHLNIDMGIVGEPTGMQAAVAEKGLMVVDVTIRGQSGHAARDIGVNAIYKSLEQIANVKDYRFERTSDFLGPVRMTVTQIESGQQHNVIPDECRWVIDTRSTDAYDNEQILRILQDLIDGEVVARSTRLNSSFLTQDHVLYQSARQLEIQCFGSPTLSDQALMSFPTVKMGPGLSERSHTADEYILLSELEEGMLKYVEYLEKVFENLK
jgi:acetylornithine deacetylase